MTVFPRLYAIVDASFGDPVRFARMLIDGGVRLLQVRNKNAAAGELLSQVERILALAPPDARILVNDRVDVAQLGGAAGVHLGQTDLPVQEARRILGPERIVGLSTHNLEQALQADRLPADYIAVGPIFSTSTKAKPDPVVGLAALSDICKSVHKPVVAIGGITAENAGRVFHAGARSVAVISDLLKAPNIHERLRQY